jgi:hypothetical protein
VSGTTPPPTPLPQHQIDFTEKLFIINTRSSKANACLASWYSFGKY